MIVGLGNITDDSIDKYHNFSGFVGVVSFVIRGGLLLYYVLGIMKTFKKARQDVKDFIKIYGTLGTIYLSSLPWGILISNLFVSYHN